MCDEHPNCRIDESYQLPTRILHVNLGDGSDDIALYEPASNETAHYISLSYCWGTHEPIRTTARNFSQHKRRIGWTSLSALFQDAVKITRLLGIKYIWIDSLCIIQDTKDWDVESQKMGLYYGNSWLTIAATASQDGNQGCIPYEKPSFMDISGPSKFGQLVGRKLPEFYNMTPQGPAYNLLNAPLFHRCWTLQERLLSRRVLHLGFDELVWECRTSLWRECGETFFGHRGDAGEPQSIQPFMAAHHQVLRGELLEPDDLCGSNTYEEAKDHLFNRSKYWHMLLDMYLRRNLTFSSDKLRAIEGLAKQLQESSINCRPLNSFFGRYILGFWAEELPQALTWGTERALQYRKWEDRDSTFPSWSWASVPGTWRPRYPQRTRSSYRQPAKAKIVSLPPNSWDIDRESGPKLYSLVLSARKIPIKLKAIDEENRGFLWETTWTPRDADSEVEHPGITLDCGIFPTCTEVELLEICEYCTYTTGLVLRERHDPSERLYERMGNFHVPAGFFDNVEPEVVRIV